MRVLFYGTYGLWTPHLETELEVADRHLAAGDEVHWIVCEGTFGRCDTNTIDRRLNCIRCQSRVARGQGLLGGPIHRHSLERFADAEVEAQVDALPASFASLDDLRAFHYGGLDAGWAALSSAIFAERDPELDPNGPIVRAFLRAAVRSYLASKKALESTGFDRVYLFNGRMAPMRGMLRAAQELGVPAYVHERGRDLEHFVLFENCMPHDIAPMVDRVRRTWDSSPLSLEDRHRVAHGWYDERTRGKMGAWMSYVDEQRPEELPPGWDPDAHNVALYTTTEFEFAAIGEEWRSPLFDGPTAAAEEIARALSERGRTHVTIRVHPNPSGRGSRSVERLLAIDHPRVTVVPPESSVSTYGLMRAADVVVTSGSTAGVEATFWGRPSVLAGRSLYAGLDAVHEPASRDELYALLEDRTLPAKDPLPAAQYGFYYATLGEPFQHFEPDGLYGGRYRGVAIRPTPLDRLKGTFVRVADKLAPRAQRVR